MIKLTRQLDNINTGKYRFNCVNRIDVSSGVGRGGARGELPPPLCDYPCPPRNYPFLSMTITLQYAICIEICNHPFLPLL